jgi:hypothetical protein
MSSDLAHRRVPLIVLVVAVVALVTSVAWTLTAGRGAMGPSWQQSGPLTGPGPVGPMMAPGSPMMGPGSPMMGPGGMMPGAPGQGPVRDLDAARQAAQRYADGWGLRAGEVMQFSRNFYVELLDSSGKRAAEVLVDPATGAVGLEYGPAMMWNTAYGMMPGRNQQGQDSVSAGQARAIADKWLQDNHTGLHAGEAEAFPGYYTLHTMRGNDVAGMLSVNARTGLVWYHTWHGQFLRMQEAS